jgi:hypothetical protein
MSEMAAFCGLRFAIDRRPERIREIATALTPEGPRRHLLQPRGDAILRRDLPAAPADPSRGR